MIHPIRLYGDPVLRRPAAPIDRVDETVRRLARDMIETMHAANGVGLAGPQVGVSRRLFVAAELAEPSPDDADEVDRESPDERIADGDGEAEDGEVGDGEVEDEDVVVAVHVMINPVITERSGVRVAPDGCLSVPGLWIDDMVRDAEIVVRYQDLAGEQRERTASGHFAHVIQHELDHLDGVLYFDRLEPDARRAFLEAHRSELAELQRRAKALLKELRGTGATAS